MLTFFWIFGVCSILLFHDGFYLPVIFSVAVFIMAASYLVLLYQQKRIGPLMLLSFIVYALPFIHIIPYTWLDFNSPPSSMWGGLAINPYMLDQTIVEIMSMIGAVGAAGLVVGVSLSHKKMTSMPQQLVYKTLSMRVFLVWTIMGVICSWLFAPEETIFTAVYTQSKAISDSWNFSSLWMFSYAFLTFALADSMFDASPKNGKMKRKIIIWSITFVVVWFQLLRGDRESLPFVVGAFFMYYLWGNNLNKTLKRNVKIKWRTLLVWMIIILFVSYIIGALRSALVDIEDTSGLKKALQENTEFSIDNMIGGTWSAALMTPLSVAGDDLIGSLPIKYGQTYLDFLTSMIPGFVADWIGYVRPIDGLRGPAWDMRYGLGGTHAVVVPFMNFRMTGVFFIIILWSYALTKMEHAAMNKTTVVNLSFLGIVTMALPHWLWYGEKAVINALIIWWLLSFFYRLCLVRKSGDNKHSADILNQPYRY